MASTMLRLALGRVTPVLGSTGLVRRVVPQARAVVHQPMQMKSFASVAAVPKPKRATAIKKAKKPAVKKVAKPKAKPKLKSWEARDADGKLIPLPSATMPKRRTAFIIFVQDRSKALREDPSVQSPGKDGSNRFDVKKMAKLVGAEWKSLSESEKKTYNDQAEEDKSKHEAAIQKWRNSLTVEDVRRQNAYLSAKKKKIGKANMGRLRPVDKPKLPVSAFFLYLAENRSTTDTVIEAAKAAGAKWKSLSKDEKEPYERKALQLREQYQKEISEWKEGQA